MRIRLRIALQLDLLAARNESSAPEEANRLIREGLEKLGLWPPEGFTEDPDEPDVKR